MRITGLGWLALSSLWFIVTGVWALGVSAAEGDDACQEDSDAWTPNTWLSVYGVVTLCSLAVACVLYLAWDESTTRKRFWQIMSAQCMLVWLAWTLIWFSVGIWVTNEHTGCHTHTLGFTTACLMGLQLLSCLGWVVIMWQMCQATEGED